MTANPSAVDIPQKDFLPFRVLSKRIKKKKRKVKSRSKIKPDVQTVYIL